ncbi:ABC transporter ATP-binding protein [Scleromatobacter humisilvae]|uniref:ATP-binding cassette domain-containing protein n=1 Tax=Scleromatobacter humisilvae TaxID=2897159 RepID=A0A9X1YL56_9BURK|nr:ATP-binding cassette domain-containing protein [Scleromatobacter humisilvae]MCK9686905.1 ATP-binding cassette domain-containing protein [Scleromatobacter humisilvae]
MGSTLVLEHLDLDVVEGEFLVLLGPSGCGKSTLLHAVAGLIDTEAGSVHIGGQDVTWADPKDRAIGMVFQSYALYPTMNVERNMSFGLRVAGLPKAEIARRVAKASSMLQLDALLARKPAQLSGGQRQRVAIGRALVREAQVFLFDEPLSNLDAKLRTELRRELKALHRDLGATMIYVTHDQVEAMTLATRVAVMRGGRIQQIGTPGEVYARPANTFVAGFLGSPSMNFVDGEIAGRGVTLGVRPEHVALLPGDDAEITLVEAMGAHEVVWLDMAGHRLAAIAPAEDVHRIGDRVGVQMDLDRAIVFDPVSQERIELPASAFQPRSR